MYHITCTSTLSKTCHQCSIKRLVTIHICSNPKVSSSLKIAITKDINSQNVLWFDEEIFFLVKCMSKIVHAKFCHVRHTFVASKFWHFECIKYLENRKCAELCVQFYDLFLILHSFNMLISAISNKFSEIDGSHRST